MTVRRFPLAVLGALILLVPAASAQDDRGADAVDDPRIPVRTLDDLPRRTHRVEGTVRDLLHDRAALLALGEQLAADIRADLQTHRIEDRALLKSRYELLQAVDLLRDDMDAALAWNPTLRGLEDKPADQMLRGVVLETLALSRHETAGDAERADAIFRASLRERVEKLPLDVIRERLVAARMSAPLATPRMIEESLAMQLDPIIAATGGDVSDAIAAAIVYNRVILDVFVPVIPAVAAVYGEILDAGATEAPERDVWSERVVGLEGSDAGTPVPVAVWDTGVDLDLFPSRHAEGAGVAFDADHRPSAELVLPLDGLHGDFDELVGFLAAMSEMQSGIESDAVLALRERILSLSGDELRRFVDDMGLLGNWSHGTHVAGIVADGNPFVRLFVVRETFPHEMISADAPSIAKYRAWGESAQAAVDAMRAAGVRVVNMSWRIPRGAVEAQLEAKGIGASPIERAELARIIFAQFRDRLHAAIAGAPEILFVAGSGNEDNDVDVNEYIPAGFRLPNLVTVGAVDQAGRKTGFTSVGGNVHLYANGHRIESVIPGGRRLRFSGTSMAAPQVTNLAAKLLALDPSLTVADLIHQITVNGDLLDEDEDRLLIHPRRTIDVLRIDL